LFSDVRRKIECRAQKERKGNGANGERERKKGKLQIITLQKALN